MDRDILHVYIPHFPIALARVVDPSLRERPVAVAPGHSDRAIIQCASSEAGSDGVFEGMPVFRALQYCPSLTLLPPDPRLSSRGMRALADISAHYSPLLEAAPPGRLYIDLTGTRRLLGPGRDAASRLDREITDRISLRGAVGVAGNKMVSRIAAGYLKKPGVCDILRGSEGTFIASLPVAVLPGVGKARERTLLTDLNLHRVEELAALTIPQLSIIFGPFSHLLHQRARGFDPSPVLPPRRSTGVTEESFLAREDNRDEALLAELCRLAEGCGIRLRASGKAAGRLVLTVHYSDGLTDSRSRVLDPPASEDLEIFAHARELFGGAYGRRVRLRGMALSCLKLRSPDRQLDLFSANDPVSHRHDSLQIALDAIREKYSRNAVRWGRTFAPVSSLASRVSRSCNPLLNHRSKALELETRD